MYPSASYWPNYHLFLKISSLHNSGLLCSRYDSDDDGSSSHYPDPVAKATGMFFEIFVQDLYFNTSLRHEAVPRRPLLIATHKSQFPVEKGTPNPAKESIT